MANVFEYASVFQSELDKAAVEQATSGWMELNDKLVRYNGGAEEDPQHGHGRLGRL